MVDQQEKAERFLALHQREEPLLLVNAWDAGSAKLLASLGFEALATTSSGFAATLGRLDGGVSRDEALAHAAALVAATAVPISADLEDGFADAPAAVAETVALARAAGLAGCSIEDFTRDQSTPIHDLDVATARIAAAAQAAHQGPARLVLTARAENYLHGRRDLTDTLARLRAYQDAGADVLFAPGITDLDEIRQLVEAVDLPVSVLALPGGPTVGELARVGVRRISVGGAFLFAAFGAAVNAAQELRDVGTVGFWELAKIGGAAARAAFAGRGTPA